MKKLVSVLFALFLLFAISVTANAAEVPLRLFSVAPDEGFSEEEVYSYAIENGFGGVLVDLRKSDSSDYLWNIVGSTGIQPFKSYFLVEERHLDEIKPGRNIVFSKGISEDAIEEYSKASGSGYVSFYLSFDDKEAFEKAKYFYEKGYFKTLFAENLLSCHSEYGYEEYLLEISEEFPGAEIITVNDLGKILLPAAKGDFYGDVFELCNQYLVNKLGGFGFCVSDFSALSENLYGSADFLLEYFKSKILDEYADFSISQKLEITRPTVSDFKVETEKYTIFGTSDPAKPLYMNGEEIERISESGLFAVSVNVPKKGKTFTFKQGEKTDSVTLSRTSGSSGTGKTTKLSSCAPTASEIVSEGKTEVNLSCIGPAGGKITAKIGDKTVTLKQAAVASKGVPAWFNGKIELSGDYSEEAAVLIGKVTYTLSYNGNVSTYESAASYYYVGKNAALAIRANAELAGVEKEASENGNYLTTLRTGCTDYVTEITENGWYKVSSGGYMKPAHCEIITGNTDITCKIDSVSFEAGENYEKLVFKCTDIPAFKGDLYKKVLSLVLFNTEFSDLTEVRRDSELIRNLIAVDNGDGSIKLNFCSTKELWGWDFFTDPENNTFSVVLKAKPELSENPAKPLSGITVAVCAGHGGPDPGALSVAGENGVTEAQINIANSHAIAESLENLGAKIVLITTEEEKLDTYGRTDPARYAYSDFYICCHANSVAENSAANLWCGTYVYYHFDKSAEFAKLLCDYISAETKRDNEGAEQGYYSVTRLSMCPAVMLEVGFVSNPKELESLIDPVDIQKTAFAVAKAVLAVLDN